MTKKEMTEIFSVMMLAWPNAEMFKGGIEKLAPTIELWAAGLSDVDFWTAQHAVLKLCRECKYPPTIADFRERISSVRCDIKSDIERAWSEIDILLCLGTPPEDILAELPHGLAKQALQSMGGPNALIIKDVHLYGDGRTEPYTRYNRKDFETAALKILRDKPALGRSKQLAAPIERSRK